MLQEGVNVVNTVFQAPAVDRPIEDTAEFIDHLKPMLEKHLANDISRVYFGDIGLYLPSHFLGPRKERRAILALAPAFDRVEPGSSTAVSESRNIGIDIIGLVNITPDFKASPDEAYGERKLAALTKKIRVFLTQHENARLDGRVSFLTVGDIRWSWMQRNDLALRGASVQVTARVRVSKQKNR
jgi:hypothetical protein